MNALKDMFDSFYESIDALFDPYFDQVGGNAEVHFGKWIVQVRLALKGAGLDDKLEIWNEAAEQVQYYGEYDPTFYTQMSNMKGVFLAIYSEIFSGVIKEELLPAEIVENERQYIIKIVRQMNGCYQMGWYDACFVMARRMLETMIIECFERFRIEENIKKADGHFFQLDSLIKEFQKNTNPWNLPQFLPKQLSKLEEIKKFGDLSAHTRHYTARKGDVDKYSDEIRISFQALLTIAQTGGK